MLALLPFALPGAILHLPIGWLAASIGFLLVLIQYGKPIAIDDVWLRKYQDDEQKTVVELTNHLADALKDVTVNTPDWRTLRFIQSARRLYKPSSVQLTPRQYVELNRRFATPCYSRSQPVRGFK